MADLPKADPTPQASPTPAPTKKTVKDFHFGRILGEGSYSTVIAAKERGTNREYAIKLLDKKHIIKEKKVKYVQIEKDILNRTSHPFIIKLFYTFQSASSLYFVLEYASNGDLLDLIRRRKFDIPAAKFYAAEIITAVEYLHQNHILHRDLKPENILISSKYHIKVADFGSAKMLEAPKEATNADAETPSKKNSFVGTAEYCSPELLNDRAASYSSDIWAVGCILYQLVAGKPPFKGANEYQTFQKIIKLEYTMPETFASQTKDIVTQILHLNPEKRPSIIQLKAHPFFEGVVWTDMDKQEAPTLELINPGANDSVEDLADHVEDLILLGSSEILENASTDDISYPHLSSTNMYEEMPAETDTVMSIQRIENNLNTSSTPPEPPAPSGMSTTKNASGALMPITTSNTNLKTTSTNRQQLLAAQNSSSLAPLVNQDELILLAGSVYKRKGIFSKRRGLLFTDMPRESMIPR
ncbi:3-phosphoinositide dependent protein kinase-1 [Chytridiales sp. JEL 0842]|nr:3-phosphoinositide dependent protein kinase-1 [Chytridiales sp. JEL 0842]